MAKKYLHVSLVEAYQIHTGKPASSELTDFVRWLTDNQKLGLDEEEIVDTIVRYGTKDPRETHHEHLARVARAIAVNPNVITITTRQEEQPHV